jgi:hypothetical protein
MSSDNKAWMVIGGGCAGVFLLGVLCVFGFVVWVATGPEGGVRVGNTMEDYALEYINENGLIEPDEAIRVYYDVTIADSSECAILTDRRLIYHRNGTNTEMSCENIEFVEIEDLGMIGEGITVEDVNGEVIYIEIAPFSNSGVFLGALERIVEENQTAARATE